MGLKVGNSIFRFEVKHGNTQKLSIGFGAYMSECWKQAARFPSLWRFRVSGSSKTRASKGHSSRTPPNWRGGGGGFGFEIEGLNTVEFLGLASVSYGLPQCPPQWAPGPTTHWAAKGAKQWVLRCGRTDCRKSLELALTEDLWHDDTMPSGLSTRRVQQMSRQAAVVFSSITSAAQHSTRPADK